MGNSPSTSTSHGVNHPEISSKTTIPEALNCSICLDVFRNSRILPCGHSFCSSCLSSKIRARKNPRCPLCRKSFQKTRVINNTHIEHIIRTLASTDIFSHSSPLSTSVPVKWDSIKIYPYRILPKPYFCPSVSQNSKHLFHKPKCLPCGHSVCSKCIPQSPINGSFKCPQCNKAWLKSVVDKCTINISLELTIQSIPIFCSMNFRSNYNEMYVIKNLVIEEPDTSLSLDDSLSSANLVLNNILPEYPSDDPSPSISTVPDYHDGSHVSTESISELDSICTVPLTIGLFNHHQTQCPLAIISCPNGGPACPNFYRKYLEAHYQSCNHMKCPHKDYGCQFSGSKSELSEHLLDNTYPHVVQLIHHRIGSPTPGQADQYFISNFKNFISSTFSKTQGEFARALQAFQNSARRGYRIQPFLDFFSILYNSQYAISFVFLLWILFFSAFATWPNQQAAVEKITSEYDSKLDFYEYLSALQFYLLFENSDETASANARAFLDRYYEKHATQYSWANLFPKEDEKLTKLVSSLKKGTPKLNKASELDEKHLTSLFRYLEDVREFPQKKYVPKSSGIFSYPPFSSLKRILTISVLFVSSFAQFLFDLATVFLLLLGGLYIVGVYFRPVRMLRPSASSVSRRLSN